MTTPTKKKSCKQNMNDNINRKHLQHMSVLFSLSKTFLQCLFSQQQVLAYFLQLCSIRSDRSREICKNLTKTRRTKAVWSVNILNIKVT